MQEHNGTRRLKSVFIWAPVHHALKVACAAEKRSMLDVLNAEVQRWCSESFELEALQASTRLEESNCWLGSQTHRLLKAQCALNEMSMTAAVTAIAVGWLRRRGHTKLLERSLGRRPGDEVERDSWRAAQNVDPGALSA